MNQKGFINIVLVILVVVLVGLGGYFVLSRKSTTTPIPQTPTNTQAQPTTNVTTKPISPTTVKKPTPPTNTTIAPVITSISPSSGKRGDLVVLIGSGFAPFGNVIAFVRNGINVGTVNGMPSSKNGTRIEFSVPWQADGEPCPTGGGCPGNALIFPLGDYQIIVSTGVATSNAVRFTVLQ